MYGIQDFAKMIIPKTKVCKKCHYNLVRDGTSKKHDLIKIVPGKNNEICEIVNPKKCKNLVLSFKSIVYMFYKNVSFDKTFEC
jgi:hypothetical protein